jgi:antitoxin VapB
MRLMTRHFMTPQKTAKLFTTGGSQAVRLPAEFRFDVDQVYVRRDEVTGDVILSTRPRTSWTDFVALRAELGPAPKDFLADRPQGGETRDPRAGLDE